MLSRPSPHRIFEGALRGLAVDDRRRRARLAARLLPDLDVEHVVDAAQRAVPVPEIQVLPDGAAGRQVLWQRLPLAPRPEHVEDGVQDLPDVHRPRPTTTLRRADQRRDQQPLGVGQIAVISQAPPIRGRSMVRLPHEAPFPDSGAAQEITTDSRDSTPFRMGSPFLALAKAHPGRLKVAYAGRGTPQHIGIELFKMMAGVDLTLVPYLGSAPALADLLNGQVDAMFDPMPSSIVHIRSGRLI